VGQAQSARKRRRACRACRAVYLEKEIALRHSPPVCPPALRWKDTLAASLSTTRLNHPWVGESLAYGLPMTYIHILHPTSYMTVPHLLGNQRSRHH
jgi:hypothetical protein